MYYKKTLIVVTSFVSIGTVCSNSFLFLDQRLFVFILFGILTEKRLATDSLNYLKNILSLLNLCVNGYSIGKSTMYVHIAI